MIGFSLFFVSLHRFLTSNMKYFEINMTIEPCTQDAQDLLAALTGEAGMETFEETETGLKGYAQQQLLDEDALKAAIEQFPMEGVSISYSISEAEDKDWNEQWEQEGFEPIVVTGLEKDGKSLTFRDESLEKDGKSLEFSDESLEKDCRKTIIIHDGRHLPNSDYPSLNSDYPSLNSDYPSLNSDYPSLNSKPSSLNYFIEIDAHMAFGTGTHETTRMICKALLGMDLKGKRILDCGCGTGILGICALKLGADSCVGYDIDEWSSDNTRHNAVINQVDDRLESFCSDATLLDSIDGCFEVVMANINRNILLQDMESFVSKMAPGATLILSGFYQSDCQMLEQKAMTLGLHLSQIMNDGEWSCMVFSKL